MGDGGKDASSGMPRPAPLTKALPAESGPIDLVQADVHGGCNVERFDRARPGNGERTRLDSRHARQAARLVAEQVTLEHPEIGGRDRFTLQIEAGNTAE